MSERNLEQLVEEQNNNLILVQQAITNYKKSPKDRKTEEYIEKCQKNIQQLWHKFQQVDHLLRTELPDTHDYFKKDWYALLGSKYFEANSQIENELVSIRAASKPSIEQERQKSLQPDASTSKAVAAKPATSKPPAQHLIKVEKQRQIIASIEKLIHTVLSSTEFNTSPFYELQLKTIQTHWAHAQMFHDQLWAQAEDSSYDYEWYITKEAEINKGILNIMNRMRKVAEDHHQEQSDTRVQPPGVKLPQLELPKFDGNYLQWRQFHDLFLEVIHNSDLPLCQKMIYLKSSLSGEAKSLIAHFSTAAANYGAAWTVLKERYDNKRIIVNSLLSKLLRQPHSSTENATSLKLLHDVTQECLLSLQGLHISTENWDPILLHILVQNLGKTSYSLWEQTLVNPTELPSIQDFLRFVKNRFQSLEALQSHNNSAISPTKKIVGASAAINSRCIVCENEHQIFNCPKFLKMSPKERLNKIQKAKRCVNCLKIGHNAKECKLSNCTKCNKKHNSLLHLDQKTAVSDPSPNIQVTATMAGSNLFQASPVLLSTARVHITDSAGSKHVCRALLDSGSQANFMSTRLAKQLGLQISNQVLNVEGIGQTQSKTKGRVNIQISSIYSGFTTRIEVHVLPHIVSAQPSQKIDKSKWEIPANIQLADKDFAQPGRIDLLIGAGIFYSILSVGQISLGPALPVLQNTLLGWIVGGEYNAERPKRLHCGVGVTNDEIEKFWKLEDVEAGLKTFTANERRCEMHFLRNIQKCEDGRFMVKLPFELKPQLLGDSKDIALQRFKSIERKLEKNPQLHEEYVKFMREYETLNHMHEISASNIPSNHYFLPHHAVFKTDSTTTKVRVVFDASAKTSTNYSLNDVLATGPTIQADVFTTLLRFRFPRFAFTADIEKMYRQVWINEEDRKYQLIWWREDSKAPLRCMQLSTVTYGTTCAPYLATRVLQYIADTNKDKYPQASNVINNNFYVDDCLAGADKMSEALVLQEQLREVLRSAGLHLRKWCANDSRLLQKIPEGDKEVSLCLSGTNSENVKTMGITWYPKDDVFAIKITQEPIQKITKRTTLADISRLFDPLGLVAPVVVTAKIFLQRLWKLKLDWDASLPQELHTKWFKFHEELICLQKLKIPRHIFNHNDPINIQVHIFADASELAYGAAAYIRSVDKNNVTIVRLLCSKSRVAPVNQITIPRLELCAAKLATDLYTRLINDQILKGYETFYWTDSTAVLGWINATSSNYHTFVANRISAIHQVSTPQQWHHVPSKQNPADLISRGLMPEQLENNVPWFYGPLFLHAPMNSWPLQAPRAVCELELRQNSSIVSTISIENSQTIFSTVNHKNSLFRLQRIMAYVYRFIMNCKQTNEKSSKSTSVPVPSTTEMENGLQILIKMSQAQEFADELKTLKQNKGVKNNSSISSLSPFIDEKGIIRVGGRLKASNLSFDKKHQMLLSYSHPLTKMVFENLHKQHLHVGAQGLLSIVRQRFWPLRGKNIARATIQSCIFCARAKPKLYEQLMGVLPKDRVQPARPFLTTGVDFFGPVWVHLKLRGKRPLKSYVAVFCCFTTKAVHMELVSDLSTDAFVGALRRFMARRGNCNKIYCDNATNFVGARNQLKELEDSVFPEAGQQKIQHECSKRNVEFSFIPPRAPHFGGLWEAAVKSAKHLLQSSISVAELTREEMETLLAEAEAIMNSRPLTPLSSDPNDLEALTPGHFLIGEPLTSLADPYAATNNLKPTTRWKVISHLKMNFWKRWSSEYLHTLQHRYKWKQEVHDIKPDTLVLIKEDNLPPLKWSLGRIKNVIRGEDGLIRVADVKTAHSIIRRPITKLAPLLIEREIVTEQNEDTRTKEDEIKHKKTDEGPQKSKRPKLTSTLMTTLFVLFLLLPLCTAHNTNLQGLQIQPGKKSNSIWSSASITLLVSCLVIPHTTASKVSFIPFQSNPGIYFERIGTANIISSSWNLINFIDVRPFWKEAELTRNCVNLLTDLCNKLETNINCNRTIHQMKKQIKRIETNNQLLNHNHRSKRGALNLVGNIANDLFGLLDSEYAEKLSSTIENLKTNDGILKRHMENQTIFLDRTLAILNKEQHQIENEFLVIEKLFNKTSSQISNLTSQVYLNHMSTMFTELALLAYMQITSFESIQNSIIDIMTDSHHGRLSADLLTPKELQTELYKIDSQHKGSTKLPLPIPNITQYYRIMKVSHQITKNFIIVNVQIPLISVKPFELLKLTAIPWIKNDTFVKLKLTTKYLTIDMLRETYSFWSDHEIQGCIVLDNERFLCQQSQPMCNYKSATTQCEIEILKVSKVTSKCSTIAAGNVSFWSSLHDHNSWIYSVGLNEQINIVCNNTPSHMELRDSGIMHIEEGCIMKTTDLTIEGHGTLTTTRRIVYTPTWDIRQQSLRHDQEDYNYSSSYHNSHNEIKVLQQELNAVKTVSLNTIRPHDIHHYGLSYTLLIIVVCYFVYLVVLQWKKHFPTKLHPPQPTPRVHVSSEAPTPDVESQMISMF